jgi:osmotically-inducible protein OsmY
MKTSTQRFSILLLAAAAFTGLVGIAGCASTSKQESTGQYMDDTAITAKVKAAIFNDACSNRRDQRRNLQGVVQLSGFVNSAADIQRAVAVAQGVSGVRSVKNDMRVK